MTGEEMARFPLQWSGLSEEMRWGQVRTGYWPPKTMVAASSIIDLNARVLENDGEIGRADIDDAPQ